MSNELTSTQIREKLAEAQQSVINELQAQKQEYNAQLLKARARIAELEAENAELLKVIELVSNNR